VLIAPWYENNPHQVVIAIDRIVHSGLQVLPRRNVRGSCPAARSGARDRRGDTQVTAECSLHFSFAASAVKACVSDMVE
jgi:hypothetical protein